MTDYETTIRTTAPVDAVFDALTTTDGLAGWWNPATGSGTTGGELQLLMNAPEPLVIRVDEATRPEVVHWTVTDCPFLPDWVGTQPAFTIAVVDDRTTEVRFTHQGLSEQVECFDMCSRSWTHYLQSLRDYLQDGQGSPFMSAGDQARRRAEAAFPGGDEVAVTVSSIHQEAVIAAPAREVFDLLTSGARFAAATGQPAEINDREGDSFSIFGGRVEGRQVELVPAERVVQAWRFGAAHPSPWEPGAYSTVRFALQPSGDGTRLVIDHTGIPEEWVEHIAGGYPTFYRDPIAAYFAD